jgi:hypothetical protein
VAHGRQTWLRWWAVDSFFPPPFGDTAVLQEGVSNHRHEGVTVKTVPGSSFEVIETEFLFQLLMRQFADPSRLDGCSQPPQVHPASQICEKILLLPRTAMLADQPRLLAGKMLLALVLDPLRGSVGDPHANSGKPCFQSAESFNGKFRAECLNAHWFMSLDDARQKCEEWRRDYNEERPHSAIGNKTPSELINRSGVQGPP